MDKNSLNDVAKELVHSKIMRHSSQSVRALAACCLADMLRLYAPDAPYDDPELKVHWILFLAIPFILTLLHRVSFHYSYPRSSILTRVKKIPTFNTTFIFSNHYPLSKVSSLLAISTMQKNWQHSLSRHSMNWASMLLWTRCWEGYQWSDMDP